ncbi:MAG: Mur ligase domain-containing protein, partial [Bifidobacteriaceae bacterium]|nr:Mur ligase domain-containing protein [Bifidobacteriaceae bacterium]
MTRSTVGPFDGQTPALPAGRIHLIGIGGAGMSAVAELLRGQGRDVSGTDREPSATLARLRALGVDARSPHDPGLVDGAGSVVRSTAIRPDNPELVRAAELGLAVVHRSEALAALTARGVVVAVSGTHGKTTVTAMTAAALEAAGLDPTYAIGASTVRTGSGAKTGAGGIAVIEADESDGSFLAYAPDVAVIANVEPDHLDHYGSPEAVEAAFAAFARRVKPGGVLIACADDPGAARVAARARAEGQAATTYGFAPAADVRIESVDDGGATERDMEPAGFAQVFVIAAPALGPVGVRLGRPVAPGGDTVPGRPAFGRVRVRLALPGRHNALNATAALLAALAGAERLSAPKPLSAIVRGLETFAGTHRRFEWRGQARGVRVYDDYAHLPTEVEATLTAARQLAGPGRVFAAFQPHLYSRTQAFAADFAAA